MAQRPALCSRHGSRAVPVAILILCLLAAGCIDHPAIPDLSGIFLPPAGSGDAKLKAYFLDVGQGDSTVVLFGNTTILIDAGETGQGDRVVGDLRSLGVTRIDLLVATHPHSDHIGGMQEVLGAFPVSRILDTGMPHTSALYEKFLETIDQKSIRYIIAEQGQAIDLDPSLRVLVLSPPAQRSGDDLNENSIVLRISYGTIDLLLTGDAGKNAEEALLKTGYALDAEILKVGHHGSSHSTGVAFLARVDPDVAVIPAGADNPYGHPHAGTLAALELAGVTVYRTDRDGTVLVSSDGSSYTVSTAKGAGGILTTATTVTPTTPPQVTTTAPSNSTVPEPMVTIPVIRIGNASFVSISGTQFNAPGDDRENLNGEWVQLLNHGDERVLLAGWTLSDQTSGAIYTFPPFILEPDKTVTVYTGSGSFNDTALFMGKTEPVWGNSGDMAVLKEAGGIIVDQKTEG